MSAEPPNPSGSPGRSRPHLSDLSRETTEEDLWNLDEEAPAQPVKPRQPKPAPAPPATREPTPPQESTGEIAPPAPRGLTPPGKPLSPRVTTTSSTDEIGELDDEEDSPEPAPAIRTKVQPTAEPVLRPIDEEPAAAAKVTAAPKAAAQEPPPPAKKPAEAAPEPRPARDEAEAHDEELLAKAAARENRSRSAAPAAKAGSLRPRLNRREVIGIATFAVVALIASVWMVTRFFTLLSFTRDSDSRPSYPLKGELVQVTSGSSFWREPIRTGESRDVAKREAIIIPVLELTIDPENSGGGSLRVIFRNAEGNPVGDAITRSFGAGRFEASGSATLGFAATDGFNADSDFQAYRTGANKLWTADVLEGPPGGTPASAFKKLSSIPILPERR